MPRKTPKRIGREQKPLKYLIPKSAKHKAFRALRLAGKIAVYTTRLGAEPWLSFNRGFLRRMEHSVRTLGVIMLRLRQQDPRLARQVEQEATSILAGRKSG